MDIEKSSEHQVVRQVCESSKVNRRRKKRLLGIIEKRKRTWVGHALRRECMLKDVLEETVEEQPK